MSILIAGYPYIKEAYLKTFDSYPEEIYFLLPQIWKAKEGRLVFRPPDRKNIFKTRAFFYHSNYPIVGGLLKGWMPLFPIYLLKVKNLKTVFSPTEPILLTTLYQAFWSKVVGKKHVVFTWENISYEKKFHGLNLFLKKLILKMTLAFSDGVVCGNRKAEEIIKKFTTKPSVAIPLSGVDTDFYNKVSADDLLDQYNLRDKFIYTFAGAIGYRKGIHLIIEALKRVINDIPNAHLIIVGTGEYEEGLKFKVESLKLGDAVTFIPWTDAQQLRRILSATHVFVYPSMAYGGWEEQFGYSMTEASLIQLPVITTKSGSVDEVVLDNVTGILVEPDSVESLKNVMIKLGKDESLRNKLGLAGRDFVARNYSYSVIAQKFHQFFSKLNQ